MSDLTYSDETYCARCDLYFFCQEDRKEHIEESPNHPRCEYCYKRFLNGNTLRNHYVYSRYHHYCASCDLHFETGSGLRIHIERSAIHGDDSDDEDEEDESRKFIEGEMDEHGHIVFDDEDPDEVYGEVYTGDDSWECYDDYDFEDEEDIGDVIPEGIYIPGAEKEEEEEEENIDGTPADEFACPICKIHPQSICSTSCGHLFCAPCIQMAYEIQGTCPVCDEAGSVEHLRRLYISV